MENVLVKKRSPRWTEQEIEALVGAIEIRKKHILGSFSSEITAASKQIAWKQVVMEVSYACFDNCIYGISVAYFNYVGKFCQYSSDAVCNVP